MVKIQAELSPSELAELQRQRTLETLEFELDLSKCSPRFHFILIGKLAILTGVGNWKSIVEREVRKACPWGLKKIDVGVYKYTLATRELILFKGYTIIWDTSTKPVLAQIERQDPFDVREVRFKPIKSIEREGVFVNLDKGKPKVKPDVITEDL